jgi:glycine/D-amino acid oxidase-like deaminating enzyme
VAFADRVMAALWRLCQAAGVELLTGDPVAAVDRHDAGLIVRTASGRTVGGAGLVVAAGNWTNQILRLLDVAPVAYEAQHVQVSHFVGVDSGAHGLGRFPIFIDHRNYLYGLPEIVTPGVKIGAHEDGIPLDDVDQERPLSEATLDKMSSYVARRFPDLDPAPATTYPCRYTTTENHRFVLSSHPDADDVLVGTGFCGEGFKFAPLVGETLADLATGAQPQFDLAPFGI